MKLPIVIVATAIVSSLATFFVIDQRSQPRVASERVHVESLASRVLGEQREIVVRVPPGYTRSPAVRHPVIYALDGASLDEPAAASAELLSRMGAMPDAIVVGLPNVSAETRARDYTPPDMRIGDPDAASGAGGADRFLAFLRDEAIPFVEARYRASDRRVLVGWSRSGLFAWYSLMAAPRLFEARLAHSPALWRDDGHAIAAMEAHLRGGPSHGALYLSLGSAENEKMTAAFTRARQVLEAHAARAGLVWRADIVEGATHQTNPALAMPIGLDWHFRRPATVRRSP